MKIFLHEKSRIFGQSLLEYAGITVLIIIGILAMGPYVVRAVNSYFQGAEEQIKDSFREDIRQAVFSHAESLVDIGIDCICTGFPNSYDECGDGATINCPSNQRMDRRNCSSALCFAEYERFYPIHQMYHCDDEIDLIISGRLTWDECFLAAGEYPVNESGFNTWLANGCGYECCFDSEIDIPMDCGTGALAGKIKKFKRCGPDLSMQYFWEDSPYCANDCGVKDPISDWCNSSTYNVNVPFPGMIIHVIDGGCDAAAMACNPATQTCPDDAWICMAECPSDPYMVANASGCECDGVWIWDTGNNKCNCSSASINTSLAAGESLEYSSPAYPSPVNFSVQVWTEDLNYCIIFYDELGTVIANYSGGGGCDGTDSDLDAVINYSGWQSAVANQVYLKVREGGTEGSSDSGYEVNCDRL